MQVFLHPQARRFPAMLFENVNVFQGKKGFCRGSVVTDGDRIVKVSLSEDACSDEPAGYLIPGLVDIHTHGNSGCDFSDCSLDGLRKMGRYLASRGVTSFLPTSMTYPYERLKEAFETARQYVLDRPADGARVLGINMEGPFFSEKKKGAQNPAYLKNPDFEAFSELNEGCGGLIRIVDAAPELPGAADFAAKASKICRVSAAHTDCSYEEAKRFYESGATHLTHLFNAMPPLHHRSPGVIPAAAERENVYAELICDGVHVHPAMVRLAFLMFSGRICLISDSMRACGMPDGDYELGGQKVILKGNRAVLEDGTIAGAALNLFDDLRTAVRFGIPVNDAILSATLYPARAAGAEEELGSIEEGKKADLVLCDRDLQVREVYLDGTALPVAR